VFTCDGTKSSNSHRDKVNLFLPLILALVNYKLGITALDQLLLIIVNFDVEPFRFPACRPLASVSDHGKFCSLPVSKIVTAEVFM
jgi:hypothetical protein